MKLKHLNLPVFSSSALLLFQLAFFTIISFSLSAQCTDRAGFDIDPNDGCTVIVTPTDDDPKITHHWIFGDETSVYGNPDFVEYSSVSHQYPVGTKTWTITHRIEIDGEYSPEFCQQSFTSSCSPSCTDLFTFEETDECGVYAFFGQTQETLEDVTYSWDFGDESSSNIQNPIHNFTTGLYTREVTLTITYLVEGEPFSLSCSELIYPSCVNVCKPSLWNYNVDGCRVDFNWIADGIYGLTDHLLWEFGDGETSTEFDPVHFYNGSDTYAITLTLFDEDGVVVDKCTKTISVDCPDCYPFNVTDELELEVPCDIATVCIGCDGTFQVNGLGDATYLKVHNVTQTQCEAAGGEWDSDDDECILCKQWDDISNPTICVDSWPFDLTPEELLVNNVYLDFQSTEADDFPAPCGIEIADDFNISSHFADLIESGACPRPGLRSDYEDSFIINEAIAIFPNPAKDQLTILSELATAKLIQVFNSNGKQIRTTNAKGRIIELDVSNLNNGFYFIQVIDAETGQKIDIEKFIIQK